MHREIYRAIRAKNPDEARKLMVQHLRMAQTSQGMEAPAEKKFSGNGTRKRPRQAATKT